MRKVLLDTIKQLNTQDIEVLTSLYLYRAMDFEQILKYIYKIDGDTASDKRKKTLIRKKLSGEGLITFSVYLPNKEAAQITNKGIEIVRYVKDLRNTIFNTETKVVKRGYYTAADLNLNTRLINHQVHLNQFILEFTERARKIKIPWIYTDEKFLSSYINIRPDGLLSILNYDFFIETDMATESKAQSIEKWQHYRSFLNTDEFKNKSRKIIVLFTIENIVSRKKIENRIAMVKQTIIDYLLDDISDDFDIIIDTRENLINYIFESLLPKTVNKNIDENKILHYFQKRNWIISYGYTFQNIFFNKYYNYYIRQVDKEGKIIMRNQQPQEYFVDFYFNKELSVLSKIRFFTRHNNFFKERFGRNFKYIIITNNINELYQDMKLLGPVSFTSNDITIFDTKNFEKQKDLYQNLLILDNFGSVYKVGSTDHSRRDFYYSLNALKAINQKVGRVNAK